MWKKRILSLTLLVLCAVLLTACQPQDQEIYSDTPPTATPTYAPIPEQQETGLIPDLTELYGSKGAVSQEIIDAKRAELFDDRIAFPGE